LEFLLKRELRHENRAANQHQRENQQDVERFLARQFGERVCSDRENPAERGSK